MVLRITSNPFPIYTITLKYGIGNSKSYSTDIVNRLNQWLPCPDIWTSASENIQAYILTYSKFFLRDRLVLWYVNCIGETYNLILIFMNNISFNLQICDHKPMLESYAYNFTKDVEDANDLVQDTLIKAIRYAEMYKEGTNLKAWLYTIMRNTFINNYRRGNKRNSIMDTTEDLTSSQLKASASNNQGENKFVMDDINRAINNLQSEYATPFLKYFEGFKYHEIAEELNIPIGTVKTRIHVARQVLKSNLKIYAQEFSRSTAMAS